MAVQIAKITGLKVVGTASGKNEALARELGTDEFIDYTREDASARGPVDAVLESVGGDSELASLRACKRGGVVVGVAGLPDLAFARASMPWFAPLGIGWMTRARRAEEKRTGVRYVWMFMRPEGGQLEEIARLVDAGKSPRPLVHRNVPVRRDHGGLRGSSSEAALAAPDRRSRVVSSAAPAKAIRRGPE